MMAAGFSMKDVDYSSFKQNKRGQKAECRGQVLIPMY